MVAYSVKSPADAYGHFYLHCCLYDTNTSNAVYLVFLIISNW